VLVADPDPFARRFVAALMRQQGYDVHEAADADDARRVAIDTSPRLVIAEAPILEPLKADPATRRIPVLVLSARAREEDVVRGLEQGAEDYMTRPFHAQELIQRAKKILARGW
jgi:DNA-binding response OmpR family regulator